MTTATWLERVTVTGGQNFFGYSRILSDLNTLKGLGMKRLSQGGNGVSLATRTATKATADSAAWQVAHGLGVEVVTYFPNRNEDGSWHGLDGEWPAAGPRRSVRMLDSEGPGLVQGYPDPNSKGTWHCIRAAIWMDSLPIISVWAPHMTREKVAEKVGRCSIIVDGSRFLIARQCNDETVGRRKMLADAFNLQESRTP